uniref:Enhancer of polycomb-like protein n=1 Tax=Leersia perrieri TaxID=77586 RepID=A0A0D9UXI9_9ORYZ
MHPPLHLAIGLGPWDHLAVAVAAAHRSPPPRARGVRPPPPIDLLHPELSRGRAAVLLLPSHRSSFSGSKRKRSTGLSSDTVDDELYGPEAARTSSGDSTWTDDSFNGRRRVAPAHSLSRNKDRHFELEVNSGGVAVIRQPRGVLRLRKLAQNVSTKSSTGGSKVLRSNGITKATQVRRRNKRGKSQTLKENRVGGNDPISCLKVENGTCGQDNSTNFCSENDVAAEKQPTVSGEPSKHVHPVKKNSVHVQEEENVNLEENAARMLCSLSGDKCASSLRKSAKSLNRSSKGYFVQRSDHLKDSCIKGEDMAGPARSLRNRDGKVSSKKRRPRRHFYEVSPHDVDPFCIVKERIRVFWPLDETWYFGLVKEYDPMTRLHHVRYDDKDEEWINLQNERIKLLLLPSEAHQKSNRHNSRSIYKKYDEREDMDRNSTGSSESGPIISLLSRSNHSRSATSSNTNKQNHTHSDVAPTLPGSSHANGSAEILEDRSTLVDSRFRFVYSRKRPYRRKNRVLNISEQDSDLNRKVIGALFASVSGRWYGTENVTSKRHGILVLSQPLKSLYKIMSEACHIWLLNTLILLQHGALVALWPSVHLDILLVDNTLGLKHLLLETCLRSAVSFFCSIVGSFNSYSKQSKHNESKMPCTSVRVQISGLDGRSQGLPVDAQDYLFFTDDIDPVIFCLDERSESVQNHLDVAAAPSLLFFHHFKLCDESNLASNGLPEAVPYDLVHLAAPASEACSVCVSPSNAGPLSMGTAGCINHSGSACSKPNTAERSINLERNCSSIGGANMTSRTICLPQKSQERCSSVIIPQDRTSDPPDKLLNKDEKVTQPTSDLIQELNHPIGRATPTAPRTTSHRSRFTSISRTFGDGSKLWQEDVMMTGFAGSKKPRTQVSYSVSPRSDDPGLKHKGHFRKIQSHSCAKTNDAKRLHDNSRNEQSSPESLTCVANVLVTVGDRGWREYDTQIMIDSDGQSERRICVKLAEGTRYAHKVCQVLQPGATNRYTHAMIWKGGTEWCLEFPDRSQWLIFKLMHDECYSHNIRAACVKNIPIPGVAETNDDHDAAPFVRSEDYIRHIGTDVEMALDESRVIYDMDSDDEAWVSSCSKVGKDSTSGKLTDDLFVRILDKFEKFAYSHNCNELSIDQMKELDCDNIPLDTIKVVHDYWQDKRKKKGMALIRHFQSAMWKIYEKQLQEWESTVFRIHGSSNGYQEKLPSKPALFAFCLRPRGLQPQIPYKGPKQRSHKKLMSSGCHSFPREQDGFYRPGRKYSEHAGDGRACESYDGGSIYSPTGYSPRLSVRTESPCSFDGSERSPTPRFLRINSVKRTASFAFSEDHQPSPSFRHQRVKRGAPDHWNTVIHDWQSSKHLFPGASQSPRVDIEELKQRDASSAAQHAAAMAKLKRERAHLLMHKADLALHKATVALMMADAIKTSSRDSSRDGRRDLRDDER